MVRLSPLGDRLFFVTITCVSSSSSQPVKTSLSLSSNTHPHPACLPHVVCQNFSLTSPRSSTTIPKTQPRVDSPSSSNARISCTHILSTALAPRILPHKGISACSRKRQRLLTSSPLDSTDDRAPSSPGQRPSKRVRLPIHRSK